MVNIKKLIVNDTGTEIGYTDSGAPSQTPYLTIVAVHGMCFTAPIFQKVQALAANKGVRFVAINRRNYPGSTPFSEEELEIVNKGSEGQKDVWLDTRGHEIASFVASFIQKEEIPPVSGRQGGVILLGWSVGVGEANAAIAAADSLPSHIHSVFTSYVRALILHEGAPIMLGLPMPEKNWAPFLVESIPLELRLPAFGHWVTSYFKHGNLSTRDLNVLSYVLPSTNRVPTIFNMSEADQNETIFDGVEAAVEGPFMFAFAAQLNKVYRKALFDEKTQKLFPLLKTSYLAGTEAPSFALAGLWRVQQDAEAAGAGSVEFVLEPGANHFIQWDDPAKALDLYLKCAGV